MQFVAVPENKEYPLVFLISANADTKVSSMSVCVS